MLKVWGVAFLRNDKIDIELRREHCEYNVPCYKRLGEKRWQKQITKLG